MISALTVGLAYQDVVTTGGAIVVAIVGVVGSIQVALIQSGRKAAQSAAEAAQTAAVQTQGSVDDHAATLEVLDELQTEIIRLHHNADRHARQSEERHREVRRDIGGIREEVRLERKERHQLAEYVIENLPRKDQP